MLNMAEVRYFGLSDIGGRWKNEDSFLILDNQATVSGDGDFSYLFAVADGMGGHAAGEVASRMACDGLQGFYRSNPSGVARRLEPEFLKRRLVQTIHDIDSHIGQTARAEKKFAHMGTTLSALVLTARSAMVAHVGDSRIYRLRNGKLKQLTVDHTFIQDLLDDGELSPEQAALHPFRHVLTRAVGTEEPLEGVQMRSLPPQRGDRYLLCTDGLHDVLKPPEIGQILKETDDPKQAARRLIEEAKQRGARDNVTVIAVSTGPPEPIGSQHGHQGGS